jgi:hypothetical protein
MNTPCAASFEKISKVQNWQIECQHAGFTPEKTLQGHPATEAETNRSFRLKLHKLALTLGKDLRREMNLGDTLADAITLLLERCRTLALDPPVPQPQAAKQ